jgi:hypothetical protein
MLERDDDKIRPLQTSWQKKLTFPQKSAAGTALRITSGGAKRNPWRVVRNDK